MRLLSWNILHGGGRRLPEIILDILAHTPDVVILSEFRPARGGMIRGVLADNGLVHQHASTDANRNGMLLASNRPCEPLDTAPQRDACRWIDVRLEGGPAITGVHTPEVRKGTRKAFAWQHLLACARERASEPHVIAGDFNTGRHRLDEEGSTFTCTTALGKLVTMGYVDAWRHLHPTAREYTWFSHEGSGFRIDHAFLSAPLAPALRDASYLHDARDQGRSDHAPLLVEFD